MTLELHFIEYLWRYIKCREFIHRLDQSVESLAVLRGQNFINTYTNCGWKRHVRHSPRDISGFIMCVSMSTVHSTVQKLLRKSARVCVVFDNFIASIIFHFVLIGVSHSLKSDQFPCIIPMQHVSKKPDPFYNW